MFSTIKMYLAAGFAAVVAIFVAIYKARGNKIEKLEVEARVADTAKKTTAKVVANKKKVAQFVADNRVAKIEMEVTDEEGNTKYNPIDRFYI